MISDNQSICPKCGGQLKYYDHVQRLVRTKFGNKKMEEIIFASGSVPVAVAARVYGKDASWVRAGIVSGWLPIGKATRSGKLVTNLEEMNSKYGRINFYISPKLLWQETGYIWRGERA